MAKERCPDNSGMTSWCLLCVFWLICMWLLYKPWEYEKCFFFISSRAYTHVNIIRCTSFPFPAPAFSYSKKYVLQHHYQSASYHHHSKIIRKKSVIYLEYILKGSTFAPAFQEKKALKQWLSDKASSGLKIRTKNFQKSLDNRNKSSYLCSPNRKANGFSPSFLIILSLSQESLRNEFKKKKQKTSEKVW